MNFRLLLVFVVLSVLHVGCGSGTDATCAGGGLSSAPLSCGSIDPKPELKDFQVSATVISARRHSNGDVVEVDMSGIAQSGSVRVGP